MLSTNSSILSSSIKGLKFGGQIGSDIHIQGWVRSVRNHKSVSFIEVNDGSCVGNMQVVTDEDISHISSGSSIEVHGTLLENHRKTGVELNAKAITLVGSCDSNSYPLQKKVRRLASLWILFMS